MKFSQDKIGFDSFAILNEGAKLFNLKQTSSNEGRFVESSSRHN